MAPVRRSRSQSYLPGRYLSRSPVLISQAAQPIVIKGGLDRRRPPAASLPPQAGRRPESRPELRKSLLQCYFEQDGAVVHERLQEEEPPKTISEVLLDEDQHDAPESDLDIASGLMREMIAEVAKADRRLGRIATLIWRSYESCYDQDAADANDLLAQLRTTRTELRQARLKIAEQDGIIRFLNERLHPS